MEIHIRLAGVQLGPYSEKQVREYLSEGLLSLTDPAMEDGTENWITVDELLSKLSEPIDTPPEPASDEFLEAPRRAPDAPPGVTHLPPRQRDSGKIPLPSAAGAQAKRTILIGPTAPAVPSPTGHTGYSTVTTSPLTPANQSTKKVSRSSLIKALAQKTTPLPTRAIAAPPKPPPFSAPAATDTPPPPPPPDAKKASLPSLLKSLTAKTVPMRSAPASPSSSPTLSSTAPLPTKPAFKPVSGSVSPPSVVKALTQKVGQAALPEVQTSPPTLGLEVATTKLASPKTKAEETPAAPAPLEPVDEPSIQASPRRKAPVLIYACAVLAVLLLYYVWSPYHAASSLLDALSTGDEVELGATIDFSSVRASLKQQVKDQIALAGAQDTVLSMLDHSIDFYVTPEGISKLVKSEPFSKEDLTQTISPEVAAKTLLGFTRQPIRNRGLASFDDFVLEMDATMLHLQFQGMGWKLKRVDLRPDLRMPVSSDSSSSAPGSASPLISPVVDTYLERGDAELKKDNWDGAIADFTQVLAIDPKSSAAYNSRGNARESKGDLDAAIKDYTQALAIDPQMASAYDGRGNAKATKNDLDGAIADFTQAIHVDPTMAVAYDSRGNAKTAKDDLDGAIADFTQAITLDPNLASAYSDRGFARQANGNLDGAISDYTQALALKPKTAIAYYNRGLARQSQGNLEAAIVDYDRALAFDPKIAGAYYYRGNAKNALHDVDGAIADYTKAVTLNPKIALAYCNRGLARQSKGDLDGAIADYTQALAVDPKIAIAYYNRGLIKAQKNDLDGAIADSSQALDLDPKNAQAYYNRGFAKLTKGNLDGAMADLKQYYDLAPKDHYADHARLYLWLISKAQNSKTDADQELSDALETSWNSSPEDLTTKTAAFLLGRITEADYLAAAAVVPDAKTEGRHCEAWYFAGMKRLLMGDKTTAIDYFHKCMATGQKDYCEYILAQAELQALEPAPPPNPPPAPPTPAPASGPAKTP